MCIEEIERDRERVVGVGFDGTKEKKVEMKQGGFYRREKRRKKIKVWPT